MNKNAMTVRATALSTVRQRNRLEARDGRFGVRVLADQLAPYIGDAPAGLPHGRPAPRGESQRLQDGKDRFLVLGHIGGTERRHGIGGPHAAQRASSATA